MDFTTTNIACNVLVDILIAKGVRNVVISPGSRNAPLIMALARNESINKRVVIDERAAAFIALGMAQQTQNPVAIVCTSGTAMLNYAPAIAEAYYRHIPLIVISADRPMEWIDQDDSQTIRQVGALGNFVKYSYDVPAKCDDRDGEWYVNRIVNDAVNLATTYPYAPVHINMQFGEPLCSEEERKNRRCRIISTLRPSEILPINDILALSEIYSSSKRVMIVAGFNDLNNDLNDSIVKLSQLPNTVVLSETVSNLHGNNIIPTIDRVITELDYDEFEDFRPDLLITFGGALITRMLKEKLRKYKAPEHWHIGINEHIVDTMQSLTMNIAIMPTQFFKQLSEYVRITESDYSTKWSDLASRALSSHNRYIAESTWCDLTAFRIIFGSIPDKCNLQLSNGTTIRYAQLFGDLIKSQCHCNRGVSGIDGSTSTALGASLEYEGSTLLITGDMSFNYDLGALASNYKNPRFKIIVMCNGGGGIFRFIKGTSSLPELEDYFEVKNDIDVSKYAAAFGYKYFEAVDENSLKSTLTTFFDCKDTAILAVKTPNETNAKILRKYFKRNY